MRLTRTAPILIAALALLGSGCLGGSGAAETVQARGQVATVGGPAPGAPAPVPNAALLLTGDDHSYATQADANGRFQVDAVPGRYHVTITGNGPTANGDLMQPIPGVVTITTPPKPVRIWISIK